MDKIVSQVYSLQKETPGSFLKFCVILLVLIVMDGQLTGQDRASQFQRQVIVGDLVGRTDLRDLRIETSQGSFPIMSHGNGKPFVVFSRSSNEVVLQFYSLRGLTDANPNTIIIRLYETERALISALILDEVDFAVLENEVSAIEASKSNSHFLPLPVQMIPNTVKLVAYNNRHPLLRSSKIRKAISYGIDHGYIIKKIILGGKANIARGPFDDDSPLYNSGMKSYRYNPKMALQILAEEGWRDSNRDGVLDKNGEPFVLNLYYQKGLRIDVAVSRIIKINLIKLGIDVRPKPLAKSEMNDRLASGAFEAVLLDHTFENNIESLSDFLSEHGAMNYTGYRSATVENYIRFYHEATDPKRKKTLIKGIQSVVNEDQPVSFLYFKWLTHDLVNVEKFQNIRYTEGPRRGSIRPFEEWIFRQTDGR